jgi:hypothetical protein
MCIGQKRYLVKNILRHNKFTAIVERDENWYIANKPEVPCANG